MGIRCTCPNGHTLNVKAEFAGKRGICPKCQARFEVPVPQHSDPTARPAGNRTEPGGTPRPAASPSATAPDAPRPQPQAPASQPPEPRQPATTEAAPQPPAAESTGPKPTAEPATRGPAGMPAADQPVWYVRPATATETYGPADDAVLRQWVAEGRVVADTYVWRTGWPDWRLAGQVPEHFPQLAAAGAPPTGPAATPPEYNSATNVTAAGDARKAPGPVDPTTAAARYQRRRQRAQRMQMAAALVLLLLVIVLTAVLVWVMRSPPEPATPSATNPPASVEPAAEPEPMAPADDNPDQPPAEPPPDPADE